MDHAMKVGARVAPLCLALGLSLFGCKERDAQPPAREVQTPETQPGEAARADALMHGEAPPSPGNGEAQPDSVAGAEADAGSHASADAATAALPPPDPKDTAGNLHDFMGFSRDEGLFAFTRYAEAAGLHLLTVVQGPKGEVKHRFQLADDASTEAARAFLREHGFSRRSGEMPKALGDGLRMRVQNGKAKVTVQPEGAGGERVLYEGDPFAQPNVAGGVKSVEKGMVSPSGRKVALRVEQVPVTEWGGIVGYIIVELDEGGAP